MKSVLTYILLLILFSQTSDAGIVVYQVPESEAEGAAAFSPHRFLDDSGRHLLLLNSSLPFERAIDFFKNASGRIIKRTANECEMRFPSRKGMMIITDRRSDPKIPYLYIDFYPNGDE